jgi:hypothetical protein
VKKKRVYSPPPVAQPRVISPPSPPAEPAASGGNPFGSLK